RIRQMVVRPTKPFTFVFNSDQLTLMDVTLTGQSTEVSLAGTIGLREGEPLNLGVTGQLNLALIAAEYPGVVSSGTVDLRVGVRVRFDDYCLWHAGLAVYAHLAAGRRRHRDPMCRVPQQLRSFYDSAEPSDLEDNTPRAARPAAPLIARRRRQNHYGSKPVGG